MRAVILVMLAALVGCKATGQGDGVLRPVGTIALEGVEGRIDHLAIDPESERLYVAALGNDSIEVIDLLAGRQVARIKGVKEPQGVYAIPRSQRLVVASGGDGKCRIIDRSLKLVGAVNLEDADNVRYDPQSHRVYVGYGKGALAAVNARTGVKVRDIPLEGHPESFQLEQQGPRIFVNVPTAGHIAVVDREQGRVLGNWPLEAAKSNFPMALDEEHGRLFVGCREPARLLVIDTQSGRTVANLECCGDSDDIFYDAAQRRIYLSGGEGCVSVFQQQDGDRYEPIARVATAPGARTCLFVPETGRLYVAVPHRGGQRAELRIYATRP